MRVVRFLVLPWLSLLPLLLAGLSSAAKAEDVDYLRDIKPVLAARCFACHGALKQESGLRTDTAAALKEGGDSGPAIVPGKPADSLLLARVSAEDPQLRMPPEGEPLTAEQVQKIAAWVAAGSAAPADEQPERDPRDHWAFQPPRRPAVPQSASTWIRNPIDAFIHAEHQRHGLVAAPPAEKEILLRRVYLDLVGLPPTRAELHAFLADESATAYERVVDRLLASPQYGERWARHWMDVWRYSDWYGRRRENDVRNSYPHIWRWRDWIVGNLNQDRPYDAMLRAMLAADELAPEDDAEIAATGFLVRSWFSLNYDQWMRDIVEHTGKAFLALRLNCALCHDHKYDPISQQEYFAFRAFFEPLELRHDRVPGGPPLERYVRYKPGSGASLQPIAAGLPRVVDHTLDAQTFIYHGGDARNIVQGLPPVAPQTPAILGTLEHPIEPIALPPAAYYPGLKPWVQAEELRRSQHRLTVAEKALADAQSAGHAPAIEAARQGREAAEAQLAAIEARLAADRVKYLGGDGDSEARAQQAAAAEATARLAEARHQAATKNAALADANAALEAAQAAAKNVPEADRPAAEKRIQDAQAAVERATKQRDAAAQALVAAETAHAEFTANPHGQYTPLSPVYHPTTTGRRAALARWLTRSDHPLTARVAVNHIWLRHFNQPLVASVADFGRSGAAPTHPALLDWLAVELVDHGWQMKHLHRLIVTSNTYRMQSRHPQSAELAARDRENRWLWRFPARRMEAEVVRDSILHVAGRLDGTLGGPELDPATADTSLRRSLYFASYPEDGGTAAFNALFDAPNPVECYRRSETVMPQQALATVNSQLVHQQAAHLAAVLRAAVAEQRPDADRETRHSALIVAAFESVLNRRPSPAELDLCREFLAKQQALHGPVTDATTQRAAASLIRSLFNHTDFVMIR